jgi:hypothetical protein
VVVHVASSIVTNKQLLDANIHVFAASVSLLSLFTGQAATVGQMGALVSVTPPVRSMGTAASTLLHLSQKSSDLGLRPSPVAMQVCT